MNTFLLDPVMWDLLIDASGNIAVATNPYSIAQDVASACRVFAGELYYDTTMGIFYLQDILGHSNAIATLKAQLEQAALTVPGVVKARCTEIYIDDSRRLTGTLEIIDITGAAQNVQF